MNHFLNFTICLLWFATIPIVAQFKNKEEKALQILENAATALNELAELKHDQGIPQALIAGAEGMVIFPGALKVALGVGGQGGKGVALIRKDDGSWSNPYFIGMGEGNIGAQIGVQSADIVLLFKRREDIMSIEKGDLALGGDVGIAAGPLGRNSSANTDIGFDAEIYSYSKSKGLYIGISLEGTVLRSHHKLNKEYYKDRSITMHEVFEELKSPYDQQVTSLIQAIIRAAL